MSVRKYYVYGSIVLIVCLAVYSYSLFSYPFSFNYELEINKHYYLFSVAAGIFAFVILLTLLKQIASPISYEKIIVAGALIILLLLYMLFPSWQAFSNEHLTVILSLVLIAAGFYLTATLPFIKYLWAGIVLLYFVQLYLVTRQYFSITDSTVDGLDTALTGSLQNSGVLSCFMVLQLPLLYFFLPRSNKKGLIRILSIIIFILCLLFTLMLLYFTRSRTALLAFAAVSLFMAWPFLKQKLSAVTSRLKSRIMLTGSVLILLALMVIAFDYLIGIKKLSAIGRVMKWEITWQHIEDHFWSGTGLGRFTWYYPQWQAEYFRTHTGTPMDYYLGAGGSYIIFNEYLQLFAEVGCIGFLVFVYLLYNFFRSTSKEQTVLLRTVKGVMIGILACGFTSYPFHTIPVIFLFMLCMATAFMIRDQNYARATGTVKTTLLFRLSSATVLFFMLYMSYYAIRHTIAVRKWDALRSNYDLTYEKAKQQYAALYPAFRDNGKFLAEYAKLVMEDPAYCHEAAQLLEESKKYFISYDTYVYAALAYKCQENYSKAIENYTFLSWYIPNRFKPRYEIAKLYEKSGEKIKAKQMAQVILEMPVKIPSNEIDEMKDEMRKLVNQ